MKAIFILCALMGLALPAHADEALYSHSVTIPNTRVLFYGAKPPYSGYFHTWRKVVVLENGSLQRDLWITWLADDSVPPIGATCEITFHIGLIEGVTVEPLDKSQSHALLDSFDCK